MENVKTHQELIQSALSSVDEITEKVTRNLNEGDHYVSHYLNDNSGFTTGLIRSDHYLPHGHYIDFGNCKSKKDVISNIRKEENEMKQLINSGMEEYIG